MIGLGNLSALHSLAYMFYLLSISWLTLYVWLKIDTVYKLSKFSLSFVCFSLELPEKNSRHISICTNKQSFFGVYDFIYVGGKIRKERLN